MRLPPVIARDGPSWRLLGRVLRGEVDPAALTGAERASFLRGAELHGLAALLEKRAPELAGPAMSVRFTAILAGATTVKAVRALEAAGVEVLVLKGLAVACLAWDDPSSRVQTDVDLLVRRTELHRAIRVLQEAGVCGEVASGGDYTHGTCLAPVPGGCVVEIHRLLSDDALRDVSVDVLFDTSMEVATPEGVIRTLGPSETAVYLSSHATLHLFERLSWLVDLAGLAHRAGVDWTRAARRARDWKVAALAGFGWARAKEFLQAPIPDEALSALRPSITQKAIASVLLRGALNIMPPYRKPLAVGFRLACDPSWRTVVHKLRVVRERIS